MAYLFKRGSVYYVKFYVAGKQKEKSLGTGVYQIAKEKQRLFESARARGESLPMPTRTSIAEIVTALSPHLHFCARRGMLNWASAVGRSPVRSVTGTIAA